MALGAGAAAGCDGERGGEGLGVLASAGRGQRLLLR